MKRFFTKTGIWLLAAAATIAVALCIVSALGSGTGFLHDALGVIASPFRTAGTAVADWFTGIGDRFESVEQLQEKNAELNRRVAELEDELRKAQNAADENKDLRQLLAQPKVVAVGEIGLDYYWHKEEEEHQIQKKMFRAQLDIAREEKLPFMIHSREAAEDTLNIVREYMQGGMYGGIIHCFSYSREIAAEYLKMGLYLGIGGVVTFKNAKKLKETVQYAPLSQLVLETDCPYMSPEPNRGKRNSSLNLPYVAQAIAELKGITAEEVIDVTRQNAEKLLGI